MKIYLYVLDTLADWEISYITAELNSGRYFSDKSIRTSVIKISDSLYPVKTMGGMEINPDESLEKIDFNENDILILPGANTWMEERNKNIIGMVKDLLQKGVKVCAICGATIALAEAGILDDRRHTSNDKEVLKMFCPNYAGSDNYVDEPAVTDGNLLTASGLAPMEFSREALRLTGLFRENTLDAWYELYMTKESKAFYELMQSISA
jgi:putative intracellular protease/amidase